MSREVSLHKTHNTNYTTASEVLSLKWSRCVQNRSGASRMLVLSTADEGPRISFHLGKGAFSLQELQRCSPVAPDRRAIVCVCMCVCACVCAQSFCVDVKVMIQKKKNAFRAAE